MDITTQLGTWRWFAPARSEEATGPERRRVSGPLFIHDAVQPWGSTTMLLDILQKDASLDQE